MEKRYINEDRYKKTARTKNRTRKIVRSNQAINNKYIQKKKKSNKKKYKVKTGKLVRFIFCLVLLLVIAIVGRALTKEENEAFIPVFFKNEVVENTESINIAVYTNTNIGENNSVITELEQYVYPMLLRVNENYEIKYEVISNINKINNREYEISINVDDKISSVVVKDLIDNIIKEKNKYYYKVENVDSVEIKSENELKITLKSDDEYFIYNLNIPIYMENEKYGLYKIEHVSQDKLVLKRKESTNKEYLKYINVMRVASEEEAIEKYKEESLDVFFSSSSNSIKMLGKYEYDIKSYNNGEGIFLIFNSKSNMTSEKYIRQTIAYSINREEILEEVGNGKGKIIDLPYIYDEEKYKYDVYAADNIILSNGYIKQGLYYLKNGRKLTLELIVNELDEEKINIANKINSELLKVGINLNVNKINEKEINKRIENGNYDILLASIYMNDNPSVNHLVDKISLTNEISSSLEVIRNSGIDSINSDIQKLKTTLSDDIGIYGIYAKQTYVIYKKGIDLFKNINYMNLFGKYFEE